jgi:hypothetical protein
MRLSDAGLRCRPTKLIYPDHRIPPWLTEAEPRDRSSRLLDEQPEIYQDRGIALTTRHAHRTSANAAALVSIKTGLLASETPSAMARNMCAAKTKANTVPDVMT